MPGVLGLLGAVAGLVALVGVYWDDAWHTDKGRDDFWIPPHVMLYAGVLVSSLAVVAWGLRVWRSASWTVTGLRRVLSTPALLAAGIGGVTTLASAPVDNMWHESFGRDAVLWSPPHLLGVAGTLTLSVGLLAGLRAAPGGVAASARVLAGAGVLGALQVPVLEYDSDVPQFPVLWFLPVATLGLAVGYVLLHDLLPGRRSMLLAAAVYTVLRVGIVGFLALLGHSLTLVPPLLVVLAIVALTPWRSMAARLVLLGVLTPLLWWPALLIQAKTTTSVPAAALPATVALSVLAGVLVAAVHGDLPALPGVATPVVLAVAGLLVLAPALPAWAHDPGQGREAMSGQFTIRRVGDQATLRLVVPGSCAHLRDGATVARRAGTENRGPLTFSDTNGTCTATGTAAAPGAGRWFVYAELIDGAPGRAERRLETWLPVAADAPVAAERSLYEPPAPDRSGLARNGVGAVLGLVVVALLVACIRIARKARPA